jgi:hypothetical protein
MRLTFFRYRLCDVINGLCGASPQTFDRKTLEDKLGAKGNEYLEKAIDEITNNSDDTYLSESEVAQKLSKHFSFERTDNTVKNTTLLKKIDGLNGKTNFDLNDYRSNKSKMVKDSWNEAGANTEPGLLADAVQHLGGTTTKEALFKYFNGEAGKDGKTGENYFKLSKHGGPSNRDLARIIDMLPSEGITQKSLDDLFNGPNSSTSQGTNSNSSQKTTKNIFYNIGTNKFTYEPNAETYVSKKPPKTSASTDATTKPKDIQILLPEYQAKSNPKLPYNHTANKGTKAYYDARQELRSALISTTSETIKNKAPGTITGGLLSVRDEDLDLINTAMGVGVLLNPDPAPPPTK